MTRAWLANRLSHTCTIQNDAGTAINSDGWVARNYVDNATAVQCYYSQRKETRMSEDEGRIVIKIQSVYFKDTVDINIDDRVKDIKDADGVTIESGPFVVIDMDKPTTINGDVSHIVAKIDRPEAS